MASWVAVGGFEAGDSTFDVGDRAVVALGDLVPPAAASVLVHDSGGLARHALLARGALGRPARGVVGGKSLGIDAVGAIGPAAVVLDDLIGDLAHAWPLLIAVAGATSVDMEKPSFSARVTGV